MSNERGANSSPDERRFKSALMRQAVPAIGDVCVVDRRATGADACRLLLAQPA